jgi:hypothetical protein
MATKVVIINGYPQAGKDTFIGYCEQYVTVLNVSTVDRVKQALKLLGWEGEKTPEIRKALSDLKDLSTALFDGPVTYIKDQVKAHPTKCLPGLIFIHSREPAEIYRLKQELDATTLLISRKPKEEITNHADRNVEKFPYDHVIDNNEGLEELHEKARKFIGRIF